MRIGSAGRDPGSLMSLYQSQKEQDDDGERDLLMQAGKSLIGVAGTAAGAGVGALFGGVGAPVGGAIGGQMAQSLAGPSMEPPPPTLGDESTRLDLFAPPPRQKLRLKY